MIVLKCGHKQNAKDGWKCKACTVAVEEPPKHAGPMKYVIGSMFDEPFGVPCENDEQVEAVIRWLKYRNTCGSVKEWGLKALRLQVVDKLKKPVPIMPKLVPFSMALEWETKTEYNQAGKLETKDVRPWRSGYMDARKAEQDRKDALAEAQRQREQLARDEHAAEYQKIEADKTAFSSMQQLRTA